MKENVNMGQTTHILHKVNLVTLSDGTDKYKCEVCGATGKRRGFSSDIILTGKKDMMEVCKTKQADHPKRISIVFVSAVGFQFSNLLPDTILKVISSPKVEYPNTIYSVWVMGAEEPVRILEGEFVEFKRTKW